MLDGGRFHIFDEVLDLAGLGAADANALFPAGLIRSEGFGVGDIHGVVFHDEDAAGASPLRPGVQVFAGLLEDLDAIVPAVADEQASPRIDGDGVRVEKLAWA